MLVAEMFSYPVSSSYFTPTLYSDKSNIIIAKKTNITILLGQNQFSVPIQNVISCCFSKSFAFLMDEWGQIYKVDLNAQNSVVLADGFDADCGLFPMEFGQILACKKTDEFYDNAYLLNVQTGIQQKVNAPPYMQNICAFKSEICCVISDPSQKHLQLYLKNLKTNESHLYTLKKNDNLYPFAFHFSTRCFAVEKSSFFHNKLEFFDCMENLQHALHLQREPQNFFWFCSGNAFAIEFTDGFQVRAYDSMEILYEQYYKGCNFLGLSCMYDSNTFCVSTEKFVQLLSINNMKSN